MNDKYKDCKTIDMTPTWESIMPIHLEAIKNAARRDDTIPSAEEEIMRVCRAMDKVIAQQKHDHSPDIITLFATPDEVRVIQYMLASNMNYEMFQEKVDDAESEDEKVVMDKLFRAFKNMQVDEGWIPDNNEEEEIKKPEPKKPHPGNWVLCDCEDGEIFYEAMDITEIWNKLYKTRQNISGYSVLTSTEYNKEYPEGYEA